LTGTELIEDFSGVDGAYYPSISSLTAADGELFFTVPDGSRYNALWTSNGTAQGTSLVKDLGATEGEYNYGPIALSVVGNNLFFAASDSAHGIELWVDDISTGTTQLVSDIDPGPASSSPSDFVEFNDELYFTANDGSVPATAELWKSDGTSTGTSLVASFTPDYTESAISSSGSPAYGVLGNLILGPLTDGVHGVELWVTNGTAGGTTELADVDPLAFATLNGLEYFLAYDQSGDASLWQTNGTSTGTIEVKDLGSLNLTQGYSYSYQTPELTVVNNKLFFATSDGIDGIDLWVSDGTSSGTVVANDFKAPAINLNAESVSVSDFTALGNDLAFVADDGVHGTQLWVSDGTSAGTQMLTSVNDVATTDDPYVEGADPSSLVVFNGTLYFKANLQSTGEFGETQEAVWKSDGTLGGTSVVFTPLAVSDSAGPVISVIDGVPGDLTVVGNQLFFTVSYVGDDFNQIQLWSINSAGLSVSQIELPAVSSPITTVSDLEAVGDQLLFETTDQSGDTTLWASDGTTEGTVPLKVLGYTAPYDYGNYNYQYSPHNALVANGVLYFSNNDGTHGNELWQSDGTAAGTYLVDDINPGPASSDPIPLAVINGQLVLAANDGIHGDELMEVEPSSQTVAPGLVPIGPQTITQGATVTLDVNLYAYDANSPSSGLEYSLSGAPAGVHINQQGVLTWKTTSSTKLGTSTFSVTVTDLNSPELTATESISVTVNALIGPVFQPISEQYVDVGQTFSFNAGQFASDGNTPPLPLTFSLTSPPAGATIDPSTGVITWPTGSTPAGTTVSFSVVAADDSTPPLTATDTFTVEVNAVSPPILEAVPPQGIDIGQTLTFDLSQYVFQDNNPEVALTYALGAGAPDGAAIDPTTGILTFTPDVSQPLGDVSIPFTVTDAAPGATPVSGSLTVSVAAADTIQPPQLLSVAYIPPITAGETFSFYVGAYASDPNTPALPLTYSLGASAPLGATINATTGLITWVTAPNQPLAAYSFPVTVADTSSPPLTATETYTVDVVPSGIIWQPELAPLPEQSINIGSQLEFNVSAFASDENLPVDLLTYSLGASAPAGASIDPTTGVFTWTPSADQATGVVFIPVTVSDYLTPPDTDTEDLEVDVYPLGAPIPPSFSVPTQSTAVGQPLTVNLNQFLSNPLDYTLTYSLADGDPTGVNINPTSGQLTWTPAADQSGPLQAIDFNVSYDNGLIAVGVVEVNVSLYAPPVIAQIPTQNTGLSQTFTLDVANYVTDANTGALPLTYSLLNYDYGATIDPATGVLTWNTPTDSQQATFTVEVTDSQVPSTSTSESFSVIAVGLPPVVQTIPTQTDQIGQELSLDVANFASEPLGQSFGLTYSLGAGAPVGAGINPYDGELVWMPSAGQPTGPTPITVIVTDGESIPQSTQETFIVNVVPPPIVPPVTSAIPVQQVSEGEAFSLNLSDYASDPNTPPLTLSYSLGAGAPVGVAVNSETGVVTWQVPADETVGTYPITVYISDSDFTVIAGFDVAVSSSTPPTELPPVLSTIPTQSGNAGTNFSFDVSSLASDPNTPPLPLTYSLSGAPTGVIINPTSGLITWAIPDNEQTGDVSFTVTVSDNESPPQTASQMLTIDVTAVPVGPTLASFGSQSVTAGSTYSLNVNQFASDTNTSGLPLTYSISGAPTGVSINPTTGLLTWAVPSSEAVGNVSFTVTVSDSSTPPLTDSETLTIAVAAAPVSPTLSSFGSQSVTAGTTYSLNVSQFASDTYSAGLPLKYSISGAPTGVSINPTTGLLTWAVPSSESAGNVSFMVTVSDSETPPLTDSKTLTIAVAAAPVAPTLSAFGTQSVTAGTTYSLNVSQFASDTYNAGLPLKYSISGNPTGVSINPTTGLLTWAVPSSQSAGNVSFTVTVSDSETPALTDSETLTIAVAAAPVAPTLSAFGTQSVTAGTTYSLNVSQFASDTYGAGLPLEYAISGNPTGVSINPTTGLLTWAVPSSESAGNVSFTVTVSDSETPPLTDSETLTIAVAAAPVAPTLSAFGTQSVTAGTTYSLNVSQFASDTYSAGLPLKYSISGNPTGVSINPTTGLLNWAVPSSEPAGNVSFTVTVSDSETPALTASKTLTIAVAASAPVIQPPTLSSIPTQSIAVGQTLSLNVASFANDPNSPPLPLTYSLVNAPAGVSISPSTGALTWAVGANETIGSYPITVQVADSATPQHVVSSAFSVTVVDPNPPVITKATVTTKKGFSITLTFNVPLNPATANNSNNFVLTEPAKKPKGKKKPAPPPTRIALSASYNAATNTVTLKGPKSVKTSPALTLTVLSAIAKLDGEQLAGNGSPGTDYVASVTSKSVSRTSAVTENRISVRINPRATALERDGATPAASRFHPSIHGVNDASRMDVHKGRPGAYLTKRSFPRV
jgi:ELWxxDGT repeat protein